MPTYLEVPILKTFCLNLIGHGGIRDGRELREGNIELFGARFSVLAKLYNKTILFSKDEAKDRFYLEV